MMDCSTSINVALIKEIYQRFGDETSRTIFENRLMYHLTDDLKYLKRIVYTTAEGKMLFDRIEKQKQVVLFGAGCWGREIAHILGKSVKCFIDNLSEEKLYMGIPVISFKSYLKNHTPQTGENEDVIVITTTLYHEEIYRQLRDHGISQGNVVNAGKMLLDMWKRQYFDLPVLQDHSVEGESFVDGGGLDGKTSTYFMDWCKGNYNKIWVFEPDANNRAACEKTLSHSGCISFDIIPKALWNEESVLAFDERSDGASRVVGKNGSSEERTEISAIEAINLDAAIHEKVTFIKMDIEGAEYNALIGSSKIITDHKPKLAISVYHKPEDIWQLPQLIYQINPDYTFYLRHYSLFSSETVLYAL